MTSAEARLWARLRNRGLRGHKFVRQAPIGPFFADFLCREQRVVVEVDGVTHASDHEIAADAKRAEAIEQHGFQIFRITNADVDTNIEGVLTALLALIEER